MQRPLASLCCLLAIVLALPILQPPSLPAATLSGQDQTTVFGPDPIFTPGIRPRVVVDAFGAIDETLTPQQRALIEKSIQEWLDAGIEYAAYYSFTELETGIRYDQARMANMGRVDLDGNLVAATTSDNRTFYPPSITRQAYRQYLIEAGKLAIDLGARHIVYDNAAADLATLSFDDEIVSAFEQSEGITNFRATVRSIVGQADISAIDLNAYINGSNPPTYLESLKADAHWDAWTAFCKQQGRAFLAEIFDALHAYASGLTPARSVQLAANRYADIEAQWDVVDLVDYMLAETFLDKRGYPARDLNYVYKAAAAAGRNFWSWNFPNNTATLNGGDNQPPSMLDRLFVAQTFANGGLAQVAGGGWSRYLGNSGVRPVLTIADFQLVARHPELFNHEPAGRIAVVLPVAGMDRYPDGIGHAVAGTTFLLSDSHQLWEVLPAYTPPGGSELLTATKLNRFDTVILPQARLLSDDAVAALEAFLNADAGHTVIGIGEVATRDEQDQDVSASRSFDDLFGGYGTDTTTYTGTVVALDNAHDYGTRMYDNAADATARAGVVTDFLADSLVSSHLPADITTDLPARVQITRFVTSDGSHIYHLVNRDVSTGQPGAVTPVAAGKTLTVPLPAAFPNPTVSIITPEQPAPQAATVSNTTITLPELGTWTIIKVGSAADGAAATDLPPWSAFNFAYRPNGSETLYYDNHRPDSRDANGALLYPYWYWKGGGDHPLPFDIPFFATDDRQVASVDLYYRHSADRTTWGEWTKLATKTFSRQETMDFASPGASDYFTISAVPPEGDGYYEFYTQATDDAGQKEHVVPGPETGYGIDSQGPPKVSGFHGDNGVQNGVWTTVTHPVFRWTNGQDLSGVAGTSLQITNTADGSTTAFCAFEEIGAGTSVDPATCSTAMPVPLADGIYQVVLQQKDNAGNASPTYQVFELRVGTAPALAPANPTATAGDGQVVVTWDLPADTSKYDFTNVYVAPASEPDILSYARNNNLVKRIGKPQTSATITGLANGTAYRFAVEGLNGIAPSDLVAPDCTFTPDAANPQSTCQAATDTCGDGTCDPGEDATSCPQDCSTPPDTTTFAISGFVRGPDNVGMPDITLKLTDSQGTATTTTTGQDGSYTFPSQPPGTYIITPQVDTTKFTIDPTSATVTVVDQDVTKDFAATPVGPPPGSTCGDGTCDQGEDATSCPQDCSTTPPDTTTNILTGTVTSSYLGYPAGVKNARIVVTDTSDPNTTFTATTQDDTGAWRMENIPNGTYTITISADHHQDHVVQNKTLTGGETRIDLPEGGLLPLAGPPAAWDSNASNSLDLGDVLSWLRIMAGAAPGQQATTGGDAAAGQGGANTLAGTVTSSVLGYEAAVQGATVTVEDSAGAILTTTTGQDGTWRIDGLADTTYTVTITAEGLQKYQATGLAVQGGQQVTVSLPEGGLLPLEPPAAPAASPWGEDGVLDLGDIARGLGKLGGN